MDVTMKKKIKIKYKREWLKAIAILRKHYSQWTMNEKPDAIGMFCPLCDVLSTKPNDNDCDDCLWVILKNTTNCVQEVHAHTTKWNLKRLDRWEKLIKEN